MELPFKHQYKTLVCEMTALGVYNVGAQKCVALHQWGPGVRNHYLIHYIVSGKGVFTVGDRTYHIRAGQAFLALPNTEIKYSHGPTAEGWRVHPRYDQLRQEFDYEHPRTGGY